MEYLICLGLFLLGAFLGAWGRGKTWKDRIKEKGLAFLPDTVELALEVSPIIKDDDGAIYAVHRCVLLNEARAKEHNRDLHSQVRKALLDLKAAEEARDELAADNAQLSKDLEAMEKKLAATVNHCATVSPAHTSS